MERVNEYDKPHVFDENWKCFEVSQETNEQGVWNAAAYTDFTTQLPQITEAPKKELTEEQKKEQEEKRKHEERLIVEQEAKNARIAREKQEKKAQEEKARKEEARKEKARGEESESVFAELFNLKFII